MWDLRQTGYGIRVCYATSIFDDANVILVPLIPVLLNAPKLAGKTGFEDVSIGGLGFHCCLYDHDRLLRKFAGDDHRPCHEFDRAGSAAGGTHCECGRCRRVGVLEYGSFRASFGVQSDGCGGWESPLRWLPGPSRREGISPGLRSGRTGPSAP